MEPNLHRPRARTPALTGRGQRPVVPEDAKATCARRWEQRGKLQPLVCGDIGLNTGPAMRRTIEPQPWREVGSCTLATA
jgi:hypothetical protein